jgi:hypothetical protein
MPVGSLKHETENASREDLIGKMIGKQSVETSGSLRVRFEGLAAVIAHENLVAAATAGRLRRAGHRAEIVSGPVMARQLLRNCRLP